MDLMFLNNYKCWWYNEIGYLTMGYSKIMCMIKKDMKKLKMFNDERHGWCRHFVRWTTVQDSAVEDPNYSLQACQGWYESCISTCTASTERGRTYWSLQRKVKPRGHSFKLQTQVWVTRVSTISLANVWSACGTIYQNQLSHPARRTC